MGAASSVETKRGSDGSGGSVPTPNAASPLLSDSIPTPPLQWRPSSTCTKHLTTIRYACWRSLLKLIAVHL